MTLLDGAGGARSTRAVGMVATCNVLNVPTCQRAKEESLEIHQGGKRHNETWDVFAPADRRLAVGDGS